MILFSASKRVKDPWVLPDHGIGETRRCNSIYFVEDCARASANICRLRNQPGPLDTLSPMIKDDKDGCDPENLPTWPLPCTGTAGLPLLAAQEGVDPSFQESDIVSKLGLTY
jgi:hypothetical protein